MEWWGEKRDTISKGKDLWSVQTRVHDHVLGHVRRGRKGNGRAKSRRQEMKMAT